MHLKGRFYSGKILDIVNLTDDDLLLSRSWCHLSNPRDRNPNEASQSEYKAGIFYHWDASKVIVCLSANSTWPKRDYGTLVGPGPLCLTSTRDVSDACRLDLGRAHRPPTWRGNRAWEALGVTGQDGKKVPWRFYRFKINRNHHRLVILPHRNLTRFLGDLPSSTHLADLLLPGTHDTLAFYGYPISQCQSPTTPLDVQLRAGVRVFDLRFSIIDGALIAYHGASPQYTPYTTVLRILAAFLRSDIGRSEAVICSIKQEDGSLGHFQQFSELVHEGIFNPEIRDTWFLENRVPTLGEVRGKAVLLSRFSDNGEEWERGVEGMGIHPYSWPNSVKEGFEWMCKDTLVRTQDWYAIPTFLSIPEKFARAVRLLEPPANEVVPRDALELLPGLDLEKSDLSLASSDSLSQASIYSTDPEKQRGTFPHTLSITFFSAATFPLALPQTVALGFGWPQWNLGVEGVNVRFGRWLLEQFAGVDVFPVNPRKQEDTRAKQRDPERRLSGWTLLDFYEWPQLDEGIVPLLVECNFVGRKLVNHGCVKG